MADILDIPPGDFEGFIFDNDGTLVVSMWLHFEAWQESYKKNGATFTLTRPLAQSMAGKGMHDTVREINKLFDQNLDPIQVVADQEAYYLENLHRIWTYDPVVDFARDKARTHPVAVASGGVRDTVHKTLKAAHLDSLFPVVITQDDVENGKPDPEMFLLAAEKMGVAPKKCLVFEDGKLGIEGARAAGMEVVYVEPEGPVE
ncbi:MAG: HAD family phosphatase [Verrucomicrobiota bacterium]